MLKNNAELRAAFEEFSSFGASRHPIGSPGPVPHHAQSIAMDSSKFAKLCRDSGLIDNETFTLIDCDIVFSKCKKVGKRKLEYDDFRRALAEIADIRQCHVSHVVALVVSAAPEINGTLPHADELIDKLTDTSLYTGMHRARFDPVTGQGRGLAGRETISPTADLSAIVSRHNSATTLGSKASAANRALSPPPHERTAASSSAGPSVFDRLNNVKSFTGTHKHRFNSDGTGRGKAGRD
ncbi:p25-alpha-domain-containing protein [Chytriomyces cf. hyalinus JEL632]|nr:p25-alpha-domain-containing protein [Chytriomyces cf. hyalinus JEL632]